MILILRTSRALPCALLAASALAAPALTAAPAAAAPPLEREQKTYDRLYDRVRDAGGTPGRHIVDDGINGRDGARPARAREVADAIRTLRRMHAGATATATATAPAAGGAGGSASGGSAGAGLEAIAACESGGEPSAVSAGGTYRGKYQFDVQTWQSVGGTGDPAAAPEAEQDARAAALAAQRGSSPWPVCG
jgi:hypothetical protein